MDEKGYIHKKEFVARVRELMQKSTADAVKQAAEMYDKLGAEKWPDNFQLPKAYVYAYTKQMERDWAPPAGPMSIRSIVSKINFNFR